MSLICETDGGSLVAGSDFSVQLCIETIVTRVDLSMESSLAICRLLILYISHHGRYWTDELVSQ